MADPAALAKLPQSYLDQDVGQEEVRIAIAFLVLQTIAAILFYSSRYLTRTLIDWDTCFFIPLSFLCVTGLCICAILSTNLGGAGFHIEALLLKDPSGKMLRIWGKLDKVVEFTDTAAITTAKLAILCLYWRIFGNSRRYRIAIYVIGTIILLNWLAGVILSLTYCQPIAYQWDKRIKGGHCRDIIVGYQMIYIPNLLTDAMMVLLPLPKLYKLHVDFATKVGLILVFLTGSVGMLTCILRMVIFFHSTALFNDPTYIGVRTFVYTIVEAGTYFIAACLPSLRPLKRHLFGDWSFSRSITSLIGRKSGGSRSGRSYRLGKPRSNDVRLENVQISKPINSASQISSKSRLENSGFRKLGDDAV